MFYSASEQGFFDPTIHRDIPSDAVKITDKLYADLLAGQASGLRIVNGPSGRPALGNKPSEQPVVPATISRFQARAALHQAGLLEKAEAAIEGADPIAKIAWADATEWRRESPTIAAIATSLRLSGKQVDDLFRAASQITA